MFRSRDASVNRIVIDPPQVLDLGEIVTDDQPLTGIGERTGKTWRFI